MDLRPKIVVSIRSEARSAVYRVALQSNFASCFGFLLGNSEPFISPVVEFSILSGIPTGMDALWSAPEVFRTQIPACQRVAEYTRTTPVGLFVAWDSSLVEHRNQLLGLFVDSAQAMNLRYVVVFPTLAHEPDWAPLVYFANGFPHDPLPWRTLRGKLSIEPYHNPRRVRAEWRILLNAIHDVPG